jgi:tetraacyldisaccharide 4'-kinase
VYNGTRPGSTAPLRLRSPVVSIGNLAMGGRGKTPVAAYVARLLVDAGERPAILSRGYRRRRADEGVVVVSDGLRICADLDRSGDEPLMLARMVPGAAVLVGEVRALSAALAERALGATVHVLDDGFQHRTLVRQTDIVIVRPDDLGGRRLPFGKLRSPVSALAAADAVIIDAEDGHTPRPPTLPPASRIFALRRRIGLPEPLEPEREWPAAGPFLAVAGIASPGRFADALGRGGWRVQQFLTFPDHHRYRRRDLDRIAAAACASQASAVLTTAKDAVRLLPLRPLPVPMAAVPLSVSIEPADEFREWLFGRIAEARR